MRSQEKGRVPRGLFPKAARKLGEMKGEGLQAQKA